MTFYDALQTYPYTTTFYVRDDATLEQIHELIRCVDDLSDCVLGKYKIGHDEYVVPGYRDLLASVHSKMVMGTFKWRIIYSTEDFTKRSHTIPGRNRETSLAVTKRVPKRAGKMPDLEHPKWQAFLEIFSSICVTKESEAIQEYIEGNISGANWPPKGAKKRR